MVRRERRKEVLTPDRCSKRKRNSPGNTSRLVLLVPSGRRSTRLRDVRLSGEGTERVRGQPTCYAAWNAEEQWRSRSLPPKRSAQTSAANVGVGKSVWAVLDAPARWLR